MWKRLEDIQWAVHYLNWGYAMRDNIQMDIAEAWCVAGKEQSPYVGNSTQNSHQFTAQWGNVKISQRRHVCDS